jgi:precorrin-2/cobalt-factor-2 C20-methyltransferase
MKGTLFGVGTGPGDPELMTLKAVHVITRCPVIAMPISGSGEHLALSIARQAVPAIDSKRILELSMPMTRDENALRESHAFAAGQIIDILERGEDVAFLTLGDPTIYSTYIYVHRLVSERGYDAVIIPGVPSFCAASARLGDCLVETGQTLHVIPGSYGDTGAQLQLDGTKVIMKSGKSFDEMRRQLHSQNQSHSVRMVENCGLHNERVYETLDKAGDRPGYFSIVIVKD